MIKAGIVGGTGYTGVELLRILSLHNEVTLASKGLMLLEWLKKPRFYTKKLYWYEYVTLNLLALRQSLVVALKLPV
jgi:hypothetical protein